MSDNFTIAERNRKENPIYAPPTFPFFLLPKKRKTRNGEEKFYAFAF